MNGLDTAMPLPYKTTKMHYHGFRMEMRCFSTYPMSHVKRKATHHPQMLTKIELTLKVNLVPRWGHNLVQKGRMLTQG